MERCQDEHTPTVAKKKERREEEREGETNGKKQRFSNKIEMYVRGSDEYKDTFWHFV